MQCHPPEPCIVGNIKIYCRTHRKTEGTTTFPLCQNSTIVKIKSTYWTDLRKKVHPCRKGCVWGLCQHLSGRSSQTGGSLPYQAGTTSTRTAAAQKHISKSGTLWGWSVYCWWGKDVMSRSSTSSITSLLREKANSIIRKLQKCLEKLKSPMVGSSWLCATREACLLLSKSRWLQVCTSQAGSSLQKPGLYKSKRRGNWLAGSPRQIALFTVWRIMETFGYHNKKPAHHCLKVFF